MNVKPGDKAIYVGPTNEDILFGDEVTICAIRKRGKIMDTWDGPARLSRAFAWYQVGEWVIPEYCLRKPDDYDITAQSWYQKILRGENLEETA